MATRNSHARKMDDDEPIRPPRRRRVLWLTVLVILATAVWFAPAAVVLTPLRDHPLHLAFAGIDGSISSRGATWNWLGSIEYRDVILVDSAGKMVAAARRVIIDKGLLRLALDPHDLGTVRLLGGEAQVEVRRGGSGIEDLLAPWLAASARASTAPSFELEVVDAAVELIDLERQNAWRITELLAAGSVRPGATIAGWTMAGRVVHTGRPQRDLAAAFAAAPPATAPERSAAVKFDRTTIAAGATATLTRSGGWSVSAPQATAAGPRSLAVAANRVPLGVSSVLATRLDAAQVIDGLADARLDIQFPAAPAAGLRITGSVMGTELAICRSDTLAEVVRLERCEMPLDVSIDGTSITLRELKVLSPLFRAEASGRVGLPQGSWWEWAETLIGDDFVVTADIDLAAAARGVSGGLQIRPDARVTGGQVQLAAAARAEGTERVLEARVSARELAVVQGQRQLVWAEPFSGWMRGRRGAARTERMRVEEARLASDAIEISASGTSETSAVQWTIDLGKLVREVAEVLDMEGIELAGTTRGRLGIDRVPASGATTATLSGSVVDLRWLAPGRPDWIDAEITVDLRGSGSLAGGTVIVDSGQAEVVAAEDRLEVSLSGGAIIDPSSLAARIVGISAVAGPWLRPAPRSEGVTADWNLAGDLGRWQARLAALAGAAALPGTPLAGTIQASAALSARGDVWQVSRAGAEVEKLVVGDGRISEPRLVATAAGMFNAVTGRIDISSAEVLTASVSLRTPGLVILPEKKVPNRMKMADRIRGRAQWQADVGRIGGWCVDAESAARWPAAGRVWGTIDLQDTPAGLNILLDATGNQLSLSAVGTQQGPDGADHPREVWVEPRAKVLVEVTREAADTVAINRLAVESSTLAATAGGTIREWSSRPQIEVGGTVSYDWAMVSRLLLPWTGGRAQLAGGTARPFSFRGPLEPLLRLAAGRGGIAAPEAPQPPSQPSSEVPLPETWLSSIRGPGREANPDRPLRAALPVALGSAARSPAMDWLRGVSVETSTGWTAGEWEGLSVESGELPLRLFEGQLALGPFDIGLGGGRLRGSPWIQLLPVPGELIVPPGRVADRVQLSGECVDRWMAWMIPLIGRSTRTHGLVSLDVDGARLPIADPYGGDMNGQMVFENLEMTPGPLLAPLANLIVRLQSVVDPRFAFGDKTVLLRVRPQPVRVQLAQRRMWHDGLIMDMGQLVLRSRGSVGLDGSLAMVVEVGLRGDFVGATPVVGRLLRTPLVIPLAGTAERPQFDAGAIDGVIKRIVDNTAEALIKDGFERGLEGLEELFGNPPPPAAQAVPSPAPPSPAAPSPAPQSLAFPPPPQ